MVKGSQESGHERFKRLATKRTNEVLRKLKILGNCSRRTAYSYSKEEVEKIFQTIERRVREVKALFFAGSSDEEFKL